MIFTGAGISTGSGIPDFRGPQGVWKRRRPVYYEQFMSSEAARIEHWDYKLEGWEGFRTAKPNVVHHAIVKLEKADKLLMVITQNIDGRRTAFDGRDKSGTIGRIARHQCSRGMPELPCEKRSEDALSVFSQTSQAAGMRVRRVSETRHHQFRAVT